jgi:hypothetical protein
VALRNTAVGVDTAGSIVAVTGVPQSVGLSKITFVGACVPLVIHSTRATFPVDWHAQCGIRNLITVLGGSGARGCTTGLVASTLSGCDELWQRVNQGGAGWKRLNGMFCGTFSPQFSLSSSQGYFLRLCCSAGAATLAADRVRVSTSCWLGLCFWLLRADPRSAVYCCSPFGGVVAWRCGGCGGFGGGPLQNFDIGLHREGADPSTRVHKLAPGMVSAVSATRAGSAAAGQILGIPRSRCSAWTLAGRVVWLVKPSAYFTQGALALVGCGMVCRLGTCGVHLCCIV